MSAVSLASGVHRCPQCKKPFDKDSSLKRHIYYCRSLQSRRSSSTFKAAPRARACIACATGKARCDHAQPSCRRCVARGLDCVYPAPASRPNAKAQQTRDVAYETVEGGGDEVRGPSDGVSRVGLGNSDDLTVSQRSIGFPNGPETFLDVPYAVDLQLGAMEEGARFDGGRWEMQMETPSLWDPLVWREGDFNPNYWAQEGTVGMADGLGEESSNTASTDLSIRPGTHHSYPSTTTSTTTTTPTKPFLEPILSNSTQHLPISIPPSPALTKLHTLLPRPRTSQTPIHQRINTLLLQNLCCYPSMIRRQQQQQQQQQQALPPFIHPLSLGTKAGVEESELEPLGNCIVLMGMLGPGAAKGGMMNRMTRKLFWRNVRMECERLCVEHPRLPRWTLLSGMQALLLYILLRIDEGVTEANEDCDALLVRGVIVLAKQLGALEPNSPHNASNASNVSASSTAWHDEWLRRRWEDWVFEESRRRLAIISRLLNNLIYFTPSSLCTLQADLLLAPLPSRTPLWEARTAGAWYSSHISTLPPSYSSFSNNDNDDDNEPDFALAATGDIVRLVKGQRYGGVEDGGGLRYVGMSEKGKKNGEGDGNGNGEWQEWCQGMDGLGGLVLLAASAAGGGG